MSALFTPLPPDDFDWASAEILLPVAPFAAAALYTRACAASHIEVEISRTRFVAFETGRAVPYDGAALKFLFSPHHNRRFMAAEHTRAAAALVQARAVPVVCIRASGRAIHVTAPRKLPVSGRVNPGGLSNHRVNLARNWRTEPPHLARVNSDHPVIAEIGALAPHFPKLKSKEV